MINDSVVTGETLGASSIRDFLRGLNLEHFADKFENHGVDEDSIAFLDDHDLEHIIGLELGPRRKLQQALGLKGREIRLHSPASPPKPQHSALRPSIKPNAQESENRKRNRKRISTKTVARKGMQSVESFEGERWITLAKSIFFPHWRKKHSFFCWRNHTVFSAGETNTLAKSLTMTSVEAVDLLDLDRFNVTRTKIEELFNQYDQDDNGGITCEELVEGFANLAPKLPMELADAKGIVLLLTESHPDMVEDGQINMNGLELILTQLRLAELELAEQFQTEQNSQNSRAKNGDMMWIIDYCPKPTRHGAMPRVSISTASSGRLGAKQPLGSELQINLFSPEDHPQRVQFFFSSRPKANCIRWVHVDAGEGLDKWNLSRLALKYHLHPLAVEDVLDPRTGTKLDPFDDHQFLSIDIFSLDNSYYKNASAASSKRGIIGPAIPKRPQVHRGNISIFFCCHARLQHQEEMAEPEATFETMISILRSASEASSWLTEWKRGGGEEQQDCDLKKSSFYKGLPGKLDGQQKEKSCEGFFKDLQNDLNSATGRLREKDVCFLLYRMLESIVNEMDPIAAAYARRLGHLKAVMSNGNLDVDGLEELDSTKLELLDLKRSIKPLQGVVNHLMKEPRFKEAGMKIYLEDVVDSIENMLLDLQQLHDMAKLVEEAYDGLLDRRMNWTLFLLSLITAIFLPAQFITGLYGMNFVNSETGDPGIPELMLPQGYLFFWCLQGTLLGITLFSVLAIHKCQCDHRCSCARRKQKTDD